MEHEACCRNKRLPDVLPSVRRETRSAQSIVSIHPNGGASHCLLFVDIRTLVAVRVVSREWKLFAELDSAWFQLALLRWSGMSSLSKKGFMPHGSAMAWYQRRHRLESFSMDNVSYNNPMLLVTVETVAAELEKYRALVEISSCNQTVVSDVFQLQVVQDDSKGLGGAVARFTEGFVSLPLKISTAELVLTLTIVRLVDGKAMSVCIDAPVYYITDDYIWMKTTKQNSLIFKQRSSQSPQFWTPPIPPIDLIPKVFLHEPRYKEVQSTSEGLVEQDKSVLVALGGLLLRYPKPCVYFWSGDEELWV